MPLQTSTQASAETIQDFANEFYEAYELCEIKLVELENNPNNVDLINLIFRAVHSTKGNLSFVDLQPLLPLLQSVEDLLSKIRHGSLTFSAGVSDVILLSMDCVKNVVDEITGHGESGITTAFIETIRDNITSIVKASPEKLQQAINTTINTLAPETIIPKQEAPPEQRKARNLLSDKKNITKVLQRHSIKPDEDMLLMISLIKPFEQRSPYWHGKTARQLLFTLGMNAIAGNRIEPTQLAAASLMHDFGMCFLPIDILHKTAIHTIKEQKQIQQHPRISHDLLGKMHHWDYAAEMTYQHHEHMNGEGYPHQLLESEICDGAKILAIVDTFDAIMHERAHIEKVKRPFIRAVLEINRYSGTQFSAEWVEIFNQFAQKLHKFNI